MVKTHHNKIKPTNFYTVVAHRTNDCIIIITYTVYDIRYIYIVYIKRILKMMITSTLHLLRLDFLISKKFGYSNNNTKSSPTPYNKNKNKNKNNIIRSSCRSRRNRNISNNSISNDRTNKTSNNNNNNKSKLKCDPNWPPNDVATDFRKAHVGTWTGKSASFDSKGVLIQVNEKYVPDAFKQFGVSVDDFEVKTTTSVDVSSGKGIEAAGLMHKTSYLYPEAGCDYGKQDIAFVDETSKGVCAGSSQMKKMFLVDGSYCEGPTTFQIERNQKDYQFLRFEFCFTEEDETFDASERRKKPSPARFRAKVLLRTTTTKVDEKNKSDTSNNDIDLRKFALHSVELIEERNDALLAMTDRSSDKNNQQIFESPATAERIIADDFGIGEWRPESGVTFVTLEALNDVPEEDFSNDYEVDDEDEEFDKNKKNKNKYTINEKNNENFDEEEKGIKMNDDDKNNEGPALLAWRRKPHDEALKMAMEKEKIEMKNEREAMEKKSSSLSSSRDGDIYDGENEPSGLLVVPWWAVKSNSSWASAPEYVVGGNSPLILLPKRSWILIESRSDDDFIIEIGLYSRQKSHQNRRVMARRYSKGRLQSCFFVKERRLTNEEVEEYRRKEDEEIGMF